MYRFSFHLLLVIKLNILCTHVCSKQCSDTHAKQTPSNVIKIGIILPLQGDYPWVIQQAFPAIKLAAESVEFALGILPSHQLELNIADSACSETVGPLAAINMYINQSAHVFLGPACEYAIAPVARFSYYWGIPVLTAGAMVSAFSDKNEYKLLTRVQGPLDKGSEFMLELLTRFSWRHLAIIYSDKKGPNSGKKNCYFSAESVFHHYSKRFNRNPYYVGFDQDKEDKTLGRILKDCSEEARSRYDLNNEFMHGEIGQKRILSSCQNPIKIVFAVA